tara:strand:+ start:82 stop:774 length:693 start_codon:yes stop_codon:yes gene_type:complete
MTAKIKLNAASGGGSFSLQAPSSSANNRVITLPDIADGTLVTSQSTLDATKLSGNLPAINGSALTGISGGLGMADRWRWTTDFTQTNTHNHLATTNSWERPDSKLGIGSNPLGTGMTQSGGIFTFPSTGYYYITFMSSARVDNDSCELFTFIRATENNSSYDNVARSLDTIQNQCTPNYISNKIEYLARVTDVSNYKVHFRCQNSGLSVTWDGDSAIDTIAATFLKVGDI